MESIHTNVFSNEELYYLKNNPNVLVANNSLDSRKSDNVYFTDA